MKKFDLLTPICNSLLSFLIGLSSILCLVTAMELEAAIGILLFACLFWAIFPQVALRLKASGLLIIAGLVLWGLFFWKAGIVDDSLTLLKQLTWIYDMAYDWGRPDFLLPHTGTDSTMALAAIACICTLTISLGLSSRSSSCVLFAAVLPVIPCLVVNDTVPAIGALFVLAICLALVLLGQQVRTVDPKRACRITAFALIPTVLATWILFYTNPQDEYENNIHQAQFHQKLLDTLDSLPLIRVEDGEISLDMDDLPTLEPPDWDIFPTVSGPTMDVTLPTITLDPGLIDIFKDQVSLDNAGPRNPGTTKVMQLKTDYRGTLYLRERGYDVYTGTAWQRTDIPQMLEANTQYMAGSNPVTITTTWLQDSLFLPYYTVTSPLELPEGRLENETDQTSYHFEAYYLHPLWKDMWQADSAVTIGQIAQYGQYLDLPVSTRKAALEILRQLQITQDSNVLLAVETIRSYVSASAKYDLNTPTMPSQYGDFAIWFLQYSNTGYCVHFASAATVLLRAAGIPARYVEGYAASVNQYSTIVTADTAHAWVEYYLPDVGWVVLDATPGYAVTPTPPQTTVPPVPTTLPTIPTVPTMVPTVPTVPTVPPTTQPTAPTITPTVPTTVPETTVPVTSQPPATTQFQPPVEPPKDSTALLTVLGILFGILGVGCGVYSQWQLRLWLKKQQLQKGDTNQRAIAYWQESQKMAALRKQKAPVALRDLAWKAKYSQYVISPEELHAFDAYLQRSIEDLKQRPWYLQAVYRFLFAAY